MRAIIASVAMVAYFRRLQSSCEPLATNYNLPMQLELLRTIVSAIVGLAIGASIVIACIPFLVDHWEQGDDARLQAAWMQHLNDLRTHGGGTAINTGNGWATSTSDK
jgi:hypothetical protein